MVSLAEQLWRCRKEGSTIEVPTDGGPTDMEAALKIQREAIAASGMKSIGYKVGSTSKEAQRILGTSEPNSSPILNEYCYESPAEILIHPSQGPAIEGEFAVRLGQDLPSRSETYTFAEVYESIEAIAGAIEVVGSRFNGGLSGKGPLLTTSDFGANIGLAVGLWNEDWRGIDLAAHGVEIYVDGQLCEEGQGARALGNPLNVVHWLANKQSQNKQGLKAGEVISTGTCTGLLGVSPGASVIAKFGFMGSLEVQFID